MEIYAVTVKSTNNLYLVATHYGVRGAISRAKFQWYLTNRNRFTDSPSRFSVRRATPEQIVEFKNGFPNANFSN